MVQGSMFKVQCSRAEIQWAITYFIKEDKIMKTDRKISRRRFLKEGFFWGCVVALFPFLKTGREEKSHAIPHPRKARYFRHLAG